MAAIGRCGLGVLLVQRLCGVPIPFPRLAKASCVIWWIALLPGVFSLPFGTNYGWEYAELPMWVNWIPVKPFVAFVGDASDQYFGTVAKRRYEKMYVSLWYTMGTVIWTAVGVLGGRF